jgi:hypothetical protein
MPISDLSDKQLDIFEGAYRKAGKIVGGKYSLSEILLEKKRRRPSVFGVREVAAKIIELATESSDGLVTYGDLWKAFCPNTPWEGHKTLRVVADSLGRVIHYCIINNLPILTVLVVQASNRKLSDDAIRNIATECRELGLQVGPDPGAFVDHQKTLARSVIVEQLPSAE